MDESPNRVVLDTNVLISAIFFGGKPERVINTILDKKIKIITSASLLLEFQEVINKKFPLEKNNFDLVLAKITKAFHKVYPKNTINIARDSYDNRVLEAAIEGNCSYIVTGDSDLLDLITFKNIKIVTPDIFLSDILID